MTKNVTKVAFAILDKTALDTAIKQITTMGKKYDALVHQAAVSAIDHHAKTGDVGFMNRLYLALGKGTRKAALSSWLLTHGGVVANTEGNKAEKPFNHSKDKTTNVEAGMADPWYDHKPDAKPDEVFDLAVALEQVLKRAKDKELVHGELITGIQGLLAMTKQVETEGGDAGGDDEEPQG